MRRHASSAPELFRSLGITPLQHVTYRDGESPGACLLVALFLEHRRGTVHRKTIDRAAMGRELGLAPWFTSGLIWGWDGFTEEDLPRSVSPVMKDWLRGNAYGRVAWMACQMERLGDAETEATTMRLPSFLQRHEQILEGGA